MSEENKTGKDAIDIAYGRVMAENKKWEDDYAKLKSAFDELSAKLARANELIDLNERAKIRENLRQMGCTYSAEELDRMELDELVKLKTYYKYFNPPFKSGSDFAKPGRRSTYDSLYELYTPLSERMKK